MYLLAELPFTVSGLMIFPILLALFFDNEKMDSMSTAFIKKFAGGFLIGAIVYIMINYMYWNVFDSLYNLNLNLPIIFGIWLIWLIFSKTVEQIRFKTFTVKSMTGGIIYLVFVAPYLFLLIPAFIGFGEQMTSTIILLTLSLLIGLWFASMFSTHTKKYFTNYIILAVLSFILFGCILYGASAM